MLQQGAEEIRARVKRTEEGDVSWCQPEVRSEEEPQETTPSISPSSSADKIYAPEYQDEDSFDDNLSENFQGKFQFDHLIQIPHFFTWLIFYFLKTCSWAIK